MLRAPHFLTLYPGGAAFCGSEHPKGSTCGQRDAELGTSTRS